MKKVLFGCLGVLVIAAIVAGVAGYYFVYRPARALMTGMAQLQEVPKLNARVRNTSAFTPPADRVLTEAAVDRYLRAQRALHDALGARLKELDAKYEALNRAQGGRTSFSDGVAALQDLGGLFVEAKRAQVEALNAQGFSLAEYEWVRQSVYAAAGIHMSVEFGRLLEQAGAGQLPSGDSWVETATGEVPDRNRELVAPHLATLQQHAALAFFGL